MNKVMSSAILVPIDGALRDYTQLKKNGSAPEDGFAIVKGNFASYDDCIVGVVKKKNAVSQVTVTFPERDTWLSLSSNYFSLKEMLTEKYGKPSDSVEEFVGSAPGDNNTRIYEVKSDRCNYYSTYETEKGSIQLSIEHDGARRCAVQLVYCDKVKAKALPEVEVLG